MLRYIFGNDEKFEELEDIIASGDCYKLNWAELPQGCYPRVTKIGFEKQGSGVVLYVDYGVSTTINKNDLRQLLDAGELRFSNMDEMKNFFHSLADVCPNNNFRPDETRNYNIVDKAKVADLRNNEQRKIVKPEEIASRLKKSVFGQDKVMDSLAEKIVMHKLSKNSTILTLMLLGPTATGKSSSSRCLAEVLTEVYGIDYGYIEVAANEFVSDHAVYRFFGAPPSYVGYNEPTLLEPVLENPYHVIVLNEIEKANNTLLTGLMEALDTGYLELANNKKINLKNCIFIFTSNLPIDMKKYESLNRFYQNEMCRDVFTKHCGRPEIAGRISCFYAFSELNDDAKIDIIEKYAKEELENFSLRLRRIDEKLVLDFLNYHSKYGARGIKNLVGDSVGRYLLYHDSLESLRETEVVMSGTVDNIEIKVA